MKRYTNEEVAQKCMDDNNNPNLFAPARLYAEMMQRSGFVIVKKEELDKYDPNTRYETIGPIKKT